MKICHFSDWHGISRKLPEADLYVCTGDMLPNTKPPPWGIRWPVSHQEEPFQRDWIKAHVGEYAALPASRAPLLIVRGNHDYIDLAPLFRDWPGLVHEFVDEPQTIKIGGITFGGFRGVPPISDCWADECTERVLKMKCEALYPLDVLVTHCPARGYLDRCDDGDLAGSTAVRQYLDSNKTRAHLFGHIHESRGTSYDGLELSNAATTVNIVDLERT